MNTTKNEIPRTYISISDQYIKDYHNIVYNFYPSFQNTIYIDYYSMDVSRSYYDINMKSFYTDINNAQYGGRFNHIHNFPVMNSTNVAYNDNADERGITPSSSSEITLNIEPNFDFMPKANDILKFSIVDGYYGFYVVTNINDSATIDKAYRSITAKLVPGLNQQKLDSLVVNESIFIQEYHKIYDKEVAILVLSIGSRVQSYVEKINSMYKSNLDFHIFENNKDIITSYERSLKQLYDNYSHHIIMESLKLSYSYDAGFYKKEPVSVWDLLINPTTDNYYKRLNQLTNFNNLRENNQYESHSYYSIDASFEDFKYHDYDHPDDYTCSATIISPNMSTSNFWIMIDAWRSALVDKNVELFENDETIYTNQNLYALMYGWLDILVTDKLLLNKMNCTINYFNTYSDNANLLETSILLSQLLYINNWVTKNISYADPIPTPTGNTI